jgi:hypothetical protein
MATVMSSEVREQISELRYETWKHWPVNWSAVLVGSLASVAAVLVVGLIGLSVGMHVLGSDRPVVDLKKIEMGALALSVFGAFLAFVIGGWVAGKVAGILHAEPAMLHGAIVWLAAVPMLVVLGAMGSVSIGGGWYSGLVASPVRGVPAAPAAHMVTTPPGSAADRNAATTRTAETNAVDVEQDAARATRNSALGAVTGLLLGLVGSVIGGWMACGEPMSLTYRRATARSY